MLEVIVHATKGTRPLTGLCAGYEMKKWRADAFADYLLESLPDFCLSFSEYQNIDHTTAVRLIKKAARSVYNTDKYRLRGEFGELMLHVVLKTVMKSMPAVSKIFYKDAANDTVKGFDAVHVIPGKKGLELWLGEVKFYDDCNKAIRDVATELDQHLEADYLRSEFVAIVNKIDPAWPHADRLRILLDQNTSLDKIFSAFCIPVLITYDSGTTASHNDLSEQYKKQLSEELRKISDKFTKRVDSIPHKIHLFLVPLNTKFALIEALNRKLKALQAA